MDESRKTNKIRGPGFAERYLSGRVIDIGCGRDLVCPWAEPFDLADGDANTITRFRAAGAYDAVHSSHCLEHMREVPSALAEWWALLKPGGYLVLVVPHEDLYEQGIWPSAFNSDHKATFRLDQAASWSPVSYEVRGLVAALPAAEVIEAAVQDQHYDHRLQFPIGAARTKPPRWVRWLKSIAKRTPLYSATLLRRLDYLALQHGVPLDQTRYEALAQIQVIARKLA